MRTHDIWSQIRIEKKIKTKAQQERTVIRLLLSCDINQLCIYIFSVTRWPVFQYTQYAFFLFFVCCCCVYGARCTVDGCSDINAVRRQRQRQRLRHTQRMRNDRQVKKNNNKFFYFVYVQKKVFFLFSCYGFFSLAAFLFQFWKLK